jgi:hypothetical protein
MTPADALLEIFPAPSGDSKDTQYLPGDGLSATQEIIVPIA